MSDTVFPGACTCSVLCTLLRQWFWISGANWSHPRSCVKTRMTGLSPKGLPCDSQVQPGLAIAALTAHLWRGGVPHIWLVDPFLVHCGPAVGMSPEGGLTLIARFEAQQPKLPPHRQRPVLSTLSRLGDVITQCLRKPEISKICILLKIPLHLP